MMNKNNEHNMEQDDVPFEEDQTSPMADEVKAFIESEDEHDSTESSDENISVPEDVKKMLEDSDHSKPKEEDTARTYFSADSTYDNADSKNPFDKLFVSVKDTDIPVTEEDKTAYIKATLFDKPVILTIKAKNGTSAKCRALTAYENDLCYEAMAIYLKKYPEYPPMLWESLIQQFRFCMQVLEYCNIEQPVIKFDYAPGKKEEFANELIEKSDKLMADIPYPAYNNRIRLLNVFNHKMAVLQSAAFNEDFWNPDDIG